MRLSFVIFIVNERRFYFLLKNSGYLKYLERHFYISYYSISFCSLSVLLIVLFLSGSVDNPYTAGAACRGEVSMCVWRGRPHRRRSDIDGVVLSDPCHNITPAHPLRSRSRLSPAVSAIVWNKQGFCVSQLRLLRLRYAHKVFRLCASTVGLQLVCLWEQMHA